MYASSAPYALWFLEPAVGIAAIIGFCAICISVIGFDRAMIRLAHLENDAERQYSGGQRARVTLARGLLAAEGSSLVLLDEPTASLDPKSRGAGTDPTWRDEDPEYGRQVRRLASKNWKDGSRGGAAARQG